MKVLVTGSGGFIGGNLRLHLAGRSDVEVMEFRLADSCGGLAERIAEADFIFHLIDGNWPQDPPELAGGNLELSTALCDALCQVVEASDRRVPIVYTSPIQAAKDKPNGQTERGAEDMLTAAHHSHGIPVHIFRLPDIFGKWCLPCDNSVVATFCHNISRDLPIQVKDPAAGLRLAYVDDVIACFLEVMRGTEPPTDADGFATVRPIYSTTVGDLAKMLRSFRESRQNLTTERVGTGLTRALYATYISYLPKEDFAYPLPLHVDPRGAFVEILKTPDCGQFSFFTAHPEVTRGGHYHHSKTEKFLVIKGRACFKFRHMQTGEFYELNTCGEKAEIVETIPGWTHDITNVGTEEMIVLLWANEIFNPSRPDTYACPL